MNRKEPEKDEGPAMVRTYSVGDLANRMTIYSPDLESDAREMADLSPSRDGDDVGRVGLSGYIAGRADMAFLDR